MDNLLNEMKGDVLRLPGILARLKPITERLGLTETEYLDLLILYLFFRILSRLTVKDSEDEKTEEKSPLPPAGPFITNSYIVKTEGIQPKFDNLIKNLNQKIDKENSEKKS